MPTSLFVSCVFRLEGVVRQNITVCTS